MLRLAVGQAPLDAVGPYSIAPLPDECRDQFGHGGIVVCNDVEAGCDKAQADDFNRIAPKRSHLVGQKPHLGSAAGLLVTDDERPVRQPQRCDLGERNVAGRHPLPLYPAIRIKKDEIRATHRIRRARRATVAAMPLFWAPPGEGRPCRPAICSCADPLVDRSVHGCLRQIPGVDRTPLGRSVESRWGA